MSYKTEEIKSFPDYMAAMVPPDGTDFVLYRGQNVDKPLLPKIARGRSDSWVAIDELEMLREFKRQAIGLIPNHEHPTNDWDWLALAQHFGLATKFLDWTQNPLAALWFAVGDEAVRDENGKLCDGVVWKFDWETPPPVDTSKSPFDAVKTIVVTPNHVTARIRVQAGWFTVHKHRQEKTPFVALERNKNYRDALTKYVIPHGKFYGFRRELNRLGVNELTLFPDVEHLCRHINWQQTLPRSKRSKVPL